MFRAANMSSDGTYRWSLSRRWGIGKTMAWIMLNPSTANHQHDDPTIRRCIKFAEGWGFASLVVVNLFAVRMTDPKDLLAHPDPVGTENGTFLRQAHRYPLVMAAWGAHPAATMLLSGGDYLPHAAEVVSALRGLQLRCLGTTASGQPRHPLYVRADTLPQPWPARSANG